MFPHMEAICTFARPVSKDTREKACVPRTNLKRKERERIENLDHCRSFISSGTTCLLRSKPCHPRTALSILPSSCSSSSPSSSPVTVALPVSWAYMAYKGYKESEAHLSWGERPKHFRGDPRMWSWSVAHSSMSRCKIGGKASCWSCSKLQYYEATRGLEDPSSRSRALKPELTSVQGWAVVGPGCKPAEK